MTDDSRIESISSLQGGRRIMATSGFYRPVRPGVLLKALNIVGGVFEGQIAPIKKPSQTTFNIIDEKKEGHPKNSGSATIFLQ